MSTTNDGANAPWVDGNALAGPLGEIIGTDLTIAELTCVGCRTTNPLAKMHVFDRAPGIVARCPNCAGVVMRIVHTPDRARIDLRGALVLSLVASESVTSNNNQQPPG